MENLAKEAKATKGQTSNVNTNELSLAFAPTVVMISSEGIIKIVFECIAKSIEFKLHRESPLDYTICNDDFFRPGSPFPPSPPRLAGNTNTASYDHTTEHMF